jgi:hypothetical protein
MAVTRAIRNSASMTKSSFDGLTCNLSTLALLSDAQSRSISAENRTGAKSGGGRELPPLDEQGRPTGVARELGQGWKVHPSDPIPPGETLTLADIEGPGCIQHIWMTPTGDYRTTILRIYYDGSDQPAVECPVADFFASAFTSFKVFAPITSLAVCVNPGNAFNCYWPMPFRKRIVITLSNLHATDKKGVYYQIDYALNPVPDDAAYFHAQFRRVNPLNYGDVVVILDGIRGKGHYVGTYLAWQVNNNGWWGEGEIKFYLDGDADPRLSDGRVVGGSTGFPTICGTGTEDYFCGSYNFENKATQQYQEFTGPYAGMPHVIRPNGVYEANTRFSLYRWHIPDPIRFTRDLKVTIQALGWRRDGRYLPLRDDIASVAYWYQGAPAAAFPPLPSVDALEIY